MSDPRQAPVQHEPIRTPCLEHQDTQTDKRETEQADPVPERTRREAADWIPLGLPGKLITVPRDDEEVLNVLPYDLAVVAPKRCHGIEQEGESVEAEFPKLLIVVTIALFESDGLRELRGRQKHVPPQDSQQRAYLRIYKRRVSHGIVVALLDGLVRMPHANQKLRNVLQLRDHSFSVPLKRSKRLRERGHRLLEDTFCRL